VEIISGVIADSSGRRANFADLAAIAETMPVPDGVQPKDPSTASEIARHETPRTSVATLPASYQSASCRARALRPSEEYDGCLDGRHSGLNRGNAARSIRERRRLAGGSANLKP
jgi:hypothetical protein